MFDIWYFRRQVQTPSRPSRSLSSITRVVRRGQYLSLSLSRSPLSFFRVNIFDNCCTEIQGQIAQGLMQMEIRLISQRNCSTLHGIQWKTPSPVLLQTACTCTMHNGWSNPEKTRILLLGLTIFGLPNVEVSKQHEEAFSTFSHFYLPRKSVACTLIVMAVLEPATMQPVTVPWLGACFQPPSPTPKEKKMHNLFLFSAASSSIFFIFFVTFLKKKGCSLMLFCVWVEVRKNKRGL